MHVLQHDGSVESELLEEKQNSLKNKMDQQEGQLKEIQTELNSLSSNADTHYLTTNFSNLKVCITVFFFFLNALTTFILMTDI